MTPFTVPITLRGRHASLEPLSATHHDGLVEATGDGEVWKLWYTSVPSPEGMRAEIERRLALQQAGSMLPGGETASAEQIGLSRIGDVSA